ncbi:MAG: thiopurine S-methyltransferase [Acidobacteriota bacterium]|nr:thiopurine S-methyltransferase [Blastocatellia bacterium]MDW8411694.1 thiopurine S-methyltransferase [Acidobacteriota bacterium]
MDAKFWQDRWEKGQIGFHLQTVNPHLIKWWPRLNLAPQTAVFVPLCGKTLDIPWLIKQGHYVVGVEISPVAIRQFLQENNLSARVTQNDKFERYEADSLCLLCGDYFDLQPEDVGNVSAVYDRAALVALPEKERFRYTAKLKTLLNKPSRMLLITLEYDQTARPGPPFSVPPQEVPKHYADLAEIKLLASHDVSNEFPDWQIQVTEHVFEILLDHAPDSLDRI